MDDDLLALERIVRADPSRPDALRAWNRASLRAGWSYEGKTLAGWLADFRKPGAYPEARRALKRIGLRAVPSLVALLKASSGRDREHALSLLRELGEEAAAAAELIRDMDKDPSFKVRIERLHALAGLGDHEGASAGIFAGLEDPDPRVRCAAIDALSGLDARSALPTLGRLLSDPSRDVRRRALHRGRVLGREDAGFRDALIAAAAIDSSERPDLLSALRECSDLSPAEGLARAMLSDNSSGPRSETRYAALQLLSLAARAGPEILDELAADLESQPRRNVPPFEYIEALATLIKRAPALCSALMDRWLGSGEVFLRLSLASTLARVGPALPDAIKNRLRAMLKDPDSGVCQEAIQALAAMRERASDTIPDLVAASDRLPSPQSVLDALGAIGHPDAGPFLFATFLARGSHRAAVLATATRLSAPIPELLPLLEPALEEDKGLASGIAGLLRAWRASKAPAFRAIHGAIDASWSGLNPRFFALARGGLLTAIHALFDAGGPPEPIEDLLGKLIADESLAFAARIALGRLAREPNRFQAFAPRLLESLRDQAWQVLEEGVRAHEALTGDPGPAYEALRPHFRHRLAKRRVAAAEAARQLRARELLPELLKALEDRSVGVRIAALKALADIGHRDALPAIEALESRSKHKQTRTLARWARRKIEDAG